jgi:Uncharacterised nucleotidyltransferase
MWAMSRTCSKPTILRALRRAPEFAGLRTLPAVNSKAGRQLMQWLDQSGLALMFLRQLQKHKATPQLCEDWHEALEARQVRNIERMGDMLQEAHRIQTRFLARRVRAACLKGFSLSPDFCEDPFLRHQTDFDFLVSADNVHAAAEVLRGCGYSTAKVNETSETCFVTPLRHIPSAKDDLYALQSHRQVDLHISIWEPCEWLPVEVPQDCLYLAQFQHRNGFEYLALSLEDKFLLQVLHVFRHSMRSWIRLSWLLEIANCMEKHAENAALWTRLIHRAGEGHLIRPLFAFVLGLVKQLFGTVVPEPLCSWPRTALSPPLRVWLNNFALDWALADWPGSLNNLLLAAEFIPDPRDRRKYWQGRLLPRKAQISLGSVATPSASSFLKLQTARLQYAAQRAVAHLTNIARLPGQQFRWKRALGSAQNLH